LIDGLIDRQGSIPIQSDEEQLRRGNVSVVNESQKNDSNRHAPAHTDTRTRNHKVMRSQVHDNISYTRTQRDKDIWSQGHS